MKTKYVILLHCSVWAGWMLINNSWIIVSWVKQPPIPLSYNIISLVAVFYSTRWMAGLYWQNVENATCMYANRDGNIEIKYPGKWEFYIWQKPLLGLVAIVLSYIGICWLIDGLFANLGLLPERYPNFYYYTFSKWSTESFYVCGGNVMAAIEYHFRKEESRRFTLEEHARQVSEENKLLHEGVNSYLKKLEKRSRQRGKDDDI